MRIYDYVTFLKQRKNITAIKFKKPEEILCPSAFSLFFGKKLKATYDREFLDFISIKVYFNKSKIRYTITFDIFNDCIEYIEVKDFLEIE